MIVVVGGVKGGSGKTTIATNLAVIRSSKNKRVLLVDADEQKSTTIFSNQRDAFGIETNWSTVQLAGNAIHSQLLRMKKDYDDVIIDVGGRDTDSQRAALVIADIYVLPFNPASYDIWTLSEVKSLIRGARSYNQKLKAVAFINRADPKGSDNKDALSFLKECEEMNCLDQTIGNRKLFRSSSSEGLGVIEVKKNGDKKAVSEMVKIYNSIFEDCVKIS